MLEIDFSCWFGSGTILGGDEVADVDSCDARGEDGDVVADEAALESELVLETV